MRLSADFAWIEGGKRYAFTACKAESDAIDVELDQLFYTAYLLTVDPDLTLSIVTEAVDTSMTDPASRHDLLRRTIEISLEQLRLDASAATDGKSVGRSGFVYRDSSFETSEALFLKQQTDGNPILLLDLGGRVAFVLRHVLGYSIKGAAAIAQMSEKRYRAELRKAYLQLASPELGPYAIACNMVEQFALA